jgi:tRNA G18 (ribose-2'-O)-methylase SpoU
LAEESQHYKEVEYNFPMALVLGGEVDGISENCMDLMDMCIQIPMLGRANSLNVATAFGIVGYEILWQYQKRR